MSKKRDIAFQCRHCEEWVESSPIHHKMNWCGCGKLGVDDQSMGSHGTRVCGTPKAYRVDGIVKQNPPPENNTK